MPRKPQPTNETEASVQIMEELAEETLERCIKLLPREVGDIREFLSIKAEEDSFTIDWEGPAAIVGLPEKYMESESVFVPQGTNPNTGGPYSYTADTREHRRTRNGKSFRVSAHTKYYSPGFKPVKGETSGRWYTANAENNFGLKMSSLRIRRNFLQEAWSKVYYGLDRELQNLLPKVLEIS
tara:strand:+ start:30 stop:575 length:546 start_codon:yes stop_codon:yes gene_type:complete